MFHIKSVKIDWWGHIAFSEQIKLTPGVNLIVGKNGSGKTSILRMIDGTSRGEGKGMNGVEEELYRDKEGQPLIRIEGEKESGDGWVVQAIKSGAGIAWSSNFEVKDRIRFISSARSVNMNSAANNPIASIPKDIAIPEPGKEIDVSLEFTSAIIKDILKRIEDLAKNSTIASDVISDYNQGLVDFEKELKMDLSRANPVYFLDYKKREVAIADLSAGEKEYLYFYAFLRRIGEEKGRVILIDEPELHLHSSQIKKLCELIRKLSENNQVLIATHSPEVMQGFIDSNIVLVSSGKVTNVKNNNELKEVLSAMGLPIDPSVFTSQWICAENEPLISLKGDNAPTTPELLSWIFGDPLEKKYWSFGSNRVKADAIISGIQQVLTEQLPIKLTIIFDGDRKCYSPETYATLSTNSEGDIHFWGFWEIENLILFPELLNVIISTKEGKSGNETFWDKVRSNKDTLFKGSIRSC